MGCCGGGTDGDEKTHYNTQVRPIKSSKDGCVEEEDLDGPIKKRGCTDVHFLLLFLAALGGMAYVGYLGYLKGDPYRIIYGTDSWGNTCRRRNNVIPGVSLSGRNMENRTKVFYYNFLALLDTTNVIKSTVLCVTQCPNAVIWEVTDLQTQAQAGHPYCRYDVAISDYLNGSAMSGGDTCPYLPLYPHSDLLNRCVPADAFTAADAVFGLATGFLSTLEATCSKTGDFWQKAASDIVVTYMECFLLWAITIGLSLVMLTLMRFIAAIIIWACVIICALAAIGGCLFCWARWWYFDSDLSSLPVADQTEAMQATVRNWLIYASLATIAAVIILLLLLIMRKRIALVVQLFREASKAIVAMPCLLLQPIWTLIALVGGLLGTGVLFLWIHSAGDPSITSEGYVEFVPDEELWINYEYLKWYYLFGVLWIMQFIFACHDVTIAGAVTSWYFTRDKKRLGFPILSSIFRLIIYHLGSIAFGSFIIALIMFFQIVLAYIQRRLSGKAGPFVDFLLKCLHCCLWCFEKFMKFINRNAYIMIAIFGYSFCRAARRAFTLLLSNALRVAAINSVGTFCLVLGKLGVVAITVVIGLEFFRDEEICYLWVPLTLVALVSLVISHTFFSVYGMTIDAIFLCFLEDSERNDGIAKPYYMSKGLMEYVENSRKVLKAEKERAKARGEAEKERNR